MPQDTGSEGTVRCNGFCARTVSDWEVCRECGGKFCRDCTSKWQVGFSTANFGFLVWGFGMHDTSFMAMMSSVQIANECDIRMQMWIYSLSSMGVSVA